MDSFLSEGSYDSSGQFQLAPRAWLEKLRHLTPVEPGEAIFLAIRALVLAGAESVEVRSRGGRAEVRGVFTAPPGSLVDSRGWHPELLSDWPERLLRPEDTGRYDLCLALALADGRVDSTCWVRWKQEGKNSQLDYVGLESPYCSSPGAPDLGHYLELHFGCAVAPVAELAGRVAELARYSPVPIHYRSDLFESVSKPTEPGYLEQFGLHDRLRLVQELEPLAEEPWHRGLGIRGKAMLGLETALPDAPDTEVLWRTSPAASLVRSGSRIVVERLLQLDLTSGPGHVLVVRGGLVVDKLPLPVEGVQLVMSDRGLQLDLGGRRVVQNESYQARVRQALARVPLLAEEACSRIGHLEYLERHERTPDTLAGLWGFLCSLAAAMLGKDVAASEVYLPCRDAQKRGRFQDALLTRLRVLASAGQPGEQG